MSTRPSAVGRGFERFGASGRKNRKGIRSTKQRAFSIECVERRELLSCAPPSVGAASVSPSQPAAQIAAVNSGLSQLHTLFQSGGGAAQAAAIHSQFGAVSNAIAAMHADNPSMMQTAGSSRAVSTMQTSLLDGTLTVDDGDTYTLTDNENCSTVTIGAGATVDLNGFTLTVGQLSPDSTAVITNNDATPNSTGTLVVTGGTEVDATI